MAGDLELAIRIRADAKQAAAILRELRKDTAALDDAGAKGARGLKKVDKGAKDLSGTFRTLKTVATGVFAALAVRESVDAALKIERIDRALVVATGSAAGSRKEFTFVREEAERLGLNLSNAASEYAKLAVAAKGTSLEGKGARDIFTAVSEASTALGLTADETAGSLNAIQQIISKGTVSAEELRGQLGERLPGAFQAAARAMNVTTEELGEMLQRGELTAEDLLPKLANELKNTFGPAAQSAANGAQASFNRFNNALLELNASFGEAILPSITEGTQLITMGLRDLGKESENLEGDDSLQNWADDAVALFALVADTARSSAFTIQQGFGSLGEALGAGAATLGAVFEGEFGRIDDIADSFFEDQKKRADEFAAFNTKLFQGRLDQIRKEREEREKNKPGEDAPASGGGKKGGATITKDQIKAADEARKKVEEARESLAGMSEKLRQQAETFGFTEAQVLKYRLSVGDLAEAVRQAGPEGQALADAILRQAHALELADAAGESAEEQQERNERMKEAAERIRDMLDPLSEFKDRLQEIRDLREGGFLNADEADAAEQEAQEALDKAKQEADGTLIDIEAMAKRAAENMQDAFADFLFDPFQDGMDGMLRSFVQTIHKMASEALAAQIFKKLMGDEGTGDGGLIKAGIGALGSFFGGGFNPNTLPPTMHSGGVVGSVPGNRSIPAMAFLGAPRLHSGGALGLRPDEVPTILQKGEGVLSRQMMKNMAAAERSGGEGGGGTRVVLVDDRGNIGDYMSSAEGEKVLVQTIRRNASTLRQVLG
jgi:tape measure domain-containing protein